MKKIVISLLSTVLIIASGSSIGWEPDNKDKQELAVAQAILEAQEKDPDLSNWFENAAGYAVFPRIGKAGIGIGGARGD